MYKDRVHPNLHLDCRLRIVKMLSVDYQPDEQTSFLNEGKDGTVFIVIQNYQLVL